MKFRKTGIVLSSLLVSTMVVSSTDIGKQVYADVKSLAMVKDTVTNNFSGGVKISIDEGDFSNKVDWDNTKDTTKEVKIPNEGDTDALIRVAVIPRWVDKDDKPFAGNTSSNVVKIKFANDYETNWLNGSDGYHYYKNIVGKGESTTNIIQSVSADLSNVVNGDLYKGKTLVVDIKAEAVEASQEAYKAAWVDLDSSITSELNELLDIKYNQNK